MPIKLAIAGRKPISLTDDVITLGSDPSCTVLLPDAENLEGQHAVIRSVNGRWQIEVGDGESVFVGGTDPCRKQWLNPGDQIRLTKGGPVIVFQPGEDHAAVDAPLVDAQPAPAKSRRPTSSDALPVADLGDVILPPDSSPAIPTTKRPSSKSAIPVLNPDAPQGGKRSPSSGSIPVVKSPSSGTIPTRKAPSSASIPTTNSKAGSSQANARQSGTRSRSAAKGDSSDEPDATLPTLQRMSFNDEADDDFDYEPVPGRRKLTAEQQEMRWVMMIVTRAVGAGVAIIIVWTLFSWVWRSMAPTTIESTAAPPTSASTSTSTSTSTSAVEQSSPPPPIASSVKSTVRPTPEPSKPVETSDLENTAASRPSDDSPDAMESATTEDNSSQSPFTKVKKDGKSDAKEKPSESASDDDVTASKSKSPSKAIQETQDSLYAVIMEDADKSRRISVGTAWSASRRYLVTTASVVSAIEEHQQQGLIASVVHVGSGKKYQIKTKKVHETYSKAADAVEDARERKDNERLAAERETQLRYDLGVLDVGRSEKLAHKLVFDPEPLENSSDAPFVMVGLPYSEKDDDKLADASDIKERRSKKQAAGEAIQDKSLGLTIQFAVDASGKNWSGSPVLNKQHQVIGVYTQLAPIKPGSGKAGKAMHGVVWIGRLNEIVPEIE